MRFFSFATIAALALLPAAAFGGTIVLNENFDELTPGGGVTGAVGAFSTINGSNVDIVGNLNGNFFASLCASPESGNCIDMGGSGGNDQGQLQSNTTFANGNYVLSFDLIGSGRGPMDGVTVTFGNFSHDYSLTSGDTSGGIVINQVASVIGGVNPNLVFSSDQASDIGLVLDNVCVVTNPSGQAIGGAAVAAVVSQCAAATPEPASGLLMLAGLPLLWFARRLNR
jgi:hypothetical protein